MIVGKVEASMVFCFHFSKTTVVVDVISFFWATETLFSFIQFEASSHDWPVLRRSYLRTWSW